LAQPEKATNLLLRHLASKRANLSNLIWRNLRSAVTAPFKAAVVSVAKANAIGMAMILAARDPLQIPRNVVGFVSVDVVDLVGRRWLKANESYRNEPVDEELLSQPPAIQNDAVVPVLINIALQAEAAVGSANHSGIRDFVAPEAMYWNPPSVHGDHSNTEWQDR